MNQLAIDTDTNGIFDGPNHTGTPERRLLLAILERALLDYVGNDRKEYEESKAWIFEICDQNICEDFSFPWVCQQLDLDTDDIRHKISQMPRRGTSRIAPWYITKNYKTTSPMPSNKTDKGTQMKGEKKLGKVLKFSNKRSLAYV